MTDNKIYITLRPYIVYLYSLELPVQPYKIKVSIIIIRSFSENMYVWLGVLDLRAALYRFTVN